MRLLDKLRGGEWRKKLSLRKLVVMAALTLVVFAIVSAVTNPVSQSTSSSLGHANSHSVHRTVVLKASNPTPANLTSVCPTWGMSTVSHAGDRWLANGVPEIGQATDAASARSALLDNWLPQIKVDPTDLAGAGLQVLHQTIDPSSLVSNGCATPAAAQLDNQLTDYIVNSVTMPGTVPSSATNSSVVNQTVTTETGVQGQASTRAAIELTGSDGTVYVMKRCGNVATLVPVQAQQQTVIVLPPASTVVNQTSTVNQTTVTQVNNCGGSGTIVVGNGDTVTQNIGNGNSGSDNGVGINDCSPVTVTKTPPPTPVCTDHNATNFNGPLPCVFPTPVCMDKTASNFGGPLPCVYPPCTVKCAPSQPVQCNQTSSPGQGYTWSWTTCSWTQTCIMTTSPGPGYTWSWTTCNWCPPLTTPVCMDKTASNFGGPLPCVYPTPPCGCQPTPPPVTQPCTVPSCATSQSPQNPVAPTLGTTVAPQPNPPAPTATAGTSLPPNTNPDGTPGPGLNTQSPTGSNTAGGSIATPNGTTPGGGPTPGSGPTGSSASGDNNGITTTSATGPTSDGTGTVAAPAG